MKYKKILLTGGSGNLGRAIMRSGQFPDILAPSHGELDITDAKVVTEFFDKHKPGAVIHCAAMVKMVEHEKDPITAIDTNIIGTCNLVKEVIRAEKKTGKSARFVYVSTDGVYPGTRGNYFERDITIPYNKYGWEKLAGENIVNLLSDFCIIRTSFFDPEHIKHESAATDKYSSRVPIGYLPKAIAFLLQSDFVGTVNVGGRSQSDYDIYKKYKTDIKPCTYEDIVRGLPIKLARNATMNSSLWGELTKGAKDLELKD